MGAKVDAFIKALKEMNQIMKADLAAGHQWRYYNGKRGASTFQGARNQKKYYTNCSTGVYWGLKRAKLATGAQCDWYGTAGGIQWCSANAEKEARKIFDIIDFKGKKVAQAAKDGSLKPGDIITYKTLYHTSVYLGDGKSFDAGHAYCKESGEGAKFIKWVGNLSHKDNGIAYVLRLKDDSPSKPQPNNKKRKFVGKIKHTGQVPVRVSPDANAALLPEYPSLNPGNLVDVYDEVTNKNGNKWYYVGIANKYFGYVFAKRVVKT